MGAGSWSRQPPADDACGLPPTSSPTDTQHRQDGVVHVIADLGWRGPGRKTDFCPMVTLQALRTFARLPPRLQPDGLLDVARVALRAWRVRAMKKPYLLGRGRQVKTVKWRPTWYGAYAVLDALGRYPKLWREVDADFADSRALAELAACLVAYNVPPDGTVTPRSTYRGFEIYSFGRKKRPSPFATALLLAVLHCIDDLAPAAAAIGVWALTSSKAAAALRCRHPTSRREVGVECRRSEGRVTEGSRNPSAVCPGLCSSTWPHDDPALVLFQVSESVGEKPIAHGDACRELGSRPECGDPVSLLYDLPSLR